ncbi:hypothetical protein ENBRE01_1175 [Enteropsectra breve]|nr:hypothetical protein ENBRE01_1175 [Enteropsectra breve]
MVKHKKKSEEESIQEERNKIRSREILGKKCISDEEFEELVRLSDGVMQFIRGNKNGGFEGFGPMVKDLNSQKIYGEPVCLSESSDEGFCFPEDYDNKNTTTTISHNGNDFNRRFAAVFGKQKKEPYYNFMSLSKLVKKKKLTLKQIFVYSYNMVAKTAFPKPKVTREGNEMTYTFGVLIMAFAVLNQTDFFVKVENNDKETIIEYLRFCLKLDDLDASYGCN